MVREEVYGYANKRVSGIYPSKYVDYKCALHCSYSGQVDSGL